MINKFSEYIDSNLEDQFDNNKNAKEEKINKESIDNLDQSTADLIDKYSKYSTEDLMNEFIKLTTEKKNSGTLNTDLERYSNILSPYLTDEQKSRMNDLFNKVK